MIGGIFYRNDRNVLEKLKKINIIKELSNKLGKDDNPK